MINGKNTLLACCLPFIDSVIVQEVCSQHSYEFEYLLPCEMHTQVVKRRKNVTLRPPENPPRFECVLTFDRVKEVEERVVGDLFGNSAHSATAFMLLLLLNGFHRHIFPLVPVYLTARERRSAKKVRGGKKQGHKKKGKSWKKCQEEADMWDVKSGD